MESLFVETLDFDLPSGRIHGQRFGSPRAPLALCLPGLSANMVSFDFLGERLGSERLQLVALDLRGRGQSAVTPLGTYGWYAHARDAFAIASELGHEKFSLIGHSMGAAVALAAAASDTNARLDRIVLIDLCGEPDPSTLPLIDAAVARLGSIYPSVEDYLTRVKQIGTVQPWSVYFERYLRYELVPAEDGGVRARSSRDAVLEDSAEFSRQDIYSLWRSLSQPVLLLRAARELLPGYGHIVSAPDAARFAADVPSARVIEIDANHYGIITADASAQAIAAFFGN
ncbi:MAG TPA: alpha/beta hydrolase [Chloroflexota bacterium]|nr:alpha/beta hydrolase [Chloroflexota bacterium]